MYMYPPGGSGRAISAGMYCSFFVFVEFGVFNRQSPQSSKAGFQPAKFSGFVRKPAHGV